MILVWIALQFIIYLNGMTDVLHAKCDVVFYANDTLIYAEAYTSKECRHNTINNFNNVNR